MLEAFRTTLLQTIIDDWDAWRIALAEPGDPDNPRMTKKQRKSRELFDEVSKEFTLQDESEEKKKVERWVKALGEDAQFNFASYAECFISENLIRQYIDDQKVALSKEAQTEIADFKKKITAALLKGKLSIEIRQADKDLSYLSMDGLAYLADNKKNTNEPCLARDADQYKPMRDALMHTALLTPAAKITLTAVYENIKGRLKTLLSGKA